MKSQEHRK